MQRIITVLIIAVFLLLPGLAGAQAPAQAPVEPPAAAAPPQPSMECVPGPGGTCVLPGKMNPEQMKQVQGKMGQCCMMQEGKGGPKCQQMQRQLDDLQKRVEALEGKKGKKK